MHGILRRSIRGSWLLVAACASDTGVVADTSGASASTSGTSSPGVSTSSMETSSSPSPDGSGDAPSSTTEPDPKLDVGFATGGETEVQDLCHVPEDGMNAPGPCDYQAPADAFDPVVQWEWAGDGAFTNSATTPLVANLTDDNNDGAIDLCDIPDVIVLVWSKFSTPGRLYVLDGASGTEHFHIDVGLDDLNPAIGDIDGDGLVEIIAQRYEGGVIAFEHDGTLAWESPSRVWPRFNAISLADLDNDGDVEILLPGGMVLDHLGAQVLPSYLPTPDEFWEGSTPIAVDLDGDDDLEIIDGRRAFHHDGDAIWNQASIECPQPPPGADVMPAVADLDDDGEPEVFLSGYPDGGSAMFCVIGADGTIEMSQLELAAAPAAIDWLRPPAIHDVDGDGTVEVGVGGSTQYFAVMRVAGNALQPLFVATGLDDTGSAGATAFDFLGDGTAEAIYMDHNHLYAYAADGQIELMVDRSSYTQIEYPVVADVDNDGSAEFVVTSNGGDAPVVRVFHDADDRWVPARRIWNQHAYHVTNVREDGTIPAVQPRFWEHLNTFRTQAQILATGGTCEPEG